MSSRTIVNKFRHNQVKDICSEYIIQSTKGSYNNILNHDSNDPTTSSSNFYEFQLKQSNYFEIVSHTTNYATATFKIALSYDNGNNYTNEQSYVYNSDGNIRVMEQTFATHIKIIYTNSISSQVSAGVLYK